MNPIAIFLGLILLAISVFFVASPFRSLAVSKKLPARSNQQKDSAKPTLEKQRQAVLLALRDLDFDYQAGKVAEDDYQTLRGNLINEAAQLMQSQEREKEDSIEALIQSRRKSGANAQLHSSPKAKANGTGERHCPHCQAPLPSGAKFCSRCGTPVQEIACPKCKQTLRKDDRFCPSCGTAVHIEKQSNLPSIATGSGSLPEGE